MLFWGRVESRTELRLFASWCLLDTGTELTLIPGRSQIACGPPVKVGTYGGEVINGVLTDVQLTVDPVGS